MIHTQVRPVRPGSPQFAPGEPGQGGEVRPKNLPLSGGVFGRTRSGVRRTQKRDQRRGEPNSPRRSIHGGVA